MRVAHNKNASEMCYLSNHVRSCVTERRFGSATTAEHQRCGEAKMERFP